MNYHHALKEIADEVTTWLWSYETWHRLYSAFWYSHAITRGLARWHQCESQSDHHCLIKLTKFFVDKKKVIPRQNIEILKQLVVEDKTLTDNNSMAFLKMHLKDWGVREERLMSHLGTFIAKSYELREYTLARHLQKIVKHVEDELFNVCKLEDRLDSTNYDASDVGMVMRHIHNYFEHDYDHKSRINMNL